MYLRIIGSNLYFYNPNNKIMYLIATAPYQYLCEELNQLDTNLLKADLEIKHFPDGEIYHKINSPIQNEHYTLIGGTISDAATIELLDIAMGLIDGGTNKLNIIIPYFGYSTMERKVMEGEIVKAKTRAQLISALPTAHCIVNIFLFDLHSEGIPYYFSSNVFTKHIYCKKLIHEIAKQLGGTDFILAATDAGRAKWVESLASEMNCDAAFIYKRRQSGSETEITGINADVKDKNVIIYDDMIRTGGSLLQAAAAYKANGAREIFVLTTHGLFVNNAIERIKQQGIISKVWCTNSHPNAVTIQNDILITSSIAPLILESIISIG
jgi:ribose-phosphate pyrophosphokinase